jgi:hypothetical protein
MKLPEKVRVYGLVWDIEVDETALSDDGHYAHTAYKEQKIVMSERYPLSRTQVTLLHELTHVAGDLLEGDDRLTELQVGVISAGLFNAIFCDNPDVLAFLGSSDGA